MTPDDLAALDLAVAKAIGLNVGREGNGVYRIGMSFLAGRYAPTTDREEAMRLLETYRLKLMPFSGGWTAFLPTVGEQIGPTPAIAICRAVVAMKAAA